MARENLTAARLAEIVGVQPSAISHILSGRNYPRFDFIASFLKAFPNLNARWFLLGEGDIYNNLIPLKKSTAAHQDNNEPPARMPVVSLDYKPHEETPSPTVIDSTDNHETKIISSKGKSIEKIIVFHSDGTFSLYENP